MAVKIGSARIGENGHITGGKAGDQTGNEVSTQNWYKHSKGWRVFRAKDTKKGEMIATAMERACANDKIGYDQAQRNSLYNQIKDKGFDTAAATSATETDCSALVRVCCLYAGIEIADCTTPTLPGMLIGSGAFSELTGAKYTESSAYLRRGDILVTKKKGHAAVVLSSGAKCEGYARVRISGGNCYVRALANLQGKRLGVAHAGDILPYAGETSENGWLCVQYGDVQGWVSGKYAALED